MSLGITTTPIEIDENIRNMAELICLNSSKELQFLDVTPSKGSKAGYFYQNVIDKIKLDGGDIQYGWIIWKWDNLMIEAEFTAVWKDKDGKFVNVTPTFDGEKQILFLPDYIRKFQGKIINNYRYPLITHPKMEEYIRLGEKITNVKNMVTNNSTAQKYMKELSKLNQRKSNLYLELIHIFDKTGRNDPCPCGSGKKYKICCLLKK